MGLIYQARHLAIQRNFAIKIIQPVEAADPIYLARFRVEAQALGRLKHPNIVDVTDFGIDPREGGLPYLVMEYLEGITLSEKLRREARSNPSNRCRFSMASRAPSISPTPTVSYIVT